MRSGSLVGLRQVVGLGSGGGGEQRGHQGMDMMCRRCLRRQVGGKICEMLREVKAVGLGCDK